MMSQQTKLKLRIIAIIIVVLTVGMKLQFIIIPSLTNYIFWFVVGSFFLLLITS
jgi:hypothetical protein